MILILLAAAVAGCSGAAGQTAGTASVAPAPSHSMNFSGSGSCHAHGRAPFMLPDARCTPGAVDPRVTQADIRLTICRRGYTRTVRPPEWVTYPEKRASMRAYGDHGRTHAYEYDHLIPLELGGAPNDTRNLWPEPGASPNLKDRVETRLRERVCAGTLSLASAQRQIARDWVALYHRLR